jgi:hypothetical protein
MTDEAPKKPTPPPRPATPPRAAEAIRVKELWLYDERNVPLQESEGGMRRILAGTSRRSNARHIEIQFEPWQRHHRVREFEDGRVTSEFCVPEAWAIYVPEPPR